MLILHLVVTNIIIVYFIYCIHVVVLLYGKCDVTHITAILSLSRHHLKIDNVKCFNKLWFLHKYFVSDKL